MTSLEVAMTLLTARQEQLVHSHKMTSTPKGGKLDIIKLYTTYMEIYIYIWNIRFNIYIYIYKYHER